MPRPRFDKLAPERRQAILTVAAEEFAEHGYDGASYNRIIERAGMSKGSCYYYFDDKQDLYITVLRDAVQRLVLDAGDMTQATDAASFWRAYQAWYVVSLHRFQREPNAIGLARSLVRAASHGRAGGALAELRTMALAWAEEFIDQGQALGAVRTDLPCELLVSVIVAMEEGVDGWLSDRLGDLTDEEIDAIAAMLTALYQRAIAPSATSTA